MIRSEPKLSVLLLLLIIISSSSISIGIRIIISVLLLILIIIIIIIIISHRRPGRAGDPATRTPLESQFQRDADAPQDGTNYTYDMLFCNSKRYVEYP